MIRSYFINENKINDINNDLKGAKVISVEVLNETCIVINFSGDRKLDIYEDDEIQGIQFSEKM